MPSARSETAESPGMDSQTALDQDYSSAGSPFFVRKRLAAIRATPPSAPARPVHSSAFPQLTPGVAGFRGGRSPVHAVYPFPASRLAPRSAKADNASVAAVSSKNRGFNGLMAVVVV